MKQMTQCSRKTISSLLHALFLGVVCSLAATPAIAEKRVALVIGNSAYTHAPALANPKNDADGMAAALKRMKFEVLAGTDLDKPAMERLLRAFAQKLGSADVALVFYAGHGLQVHGRNYLVPVDGKLEQETDLAFEAVPLDLIQGLMEQSQRTNIMILDACRDNPLARNLARTMGTRSTGIGRGLGEAKAGVGTLIVYATQPGNVALDGEGANSPFTASLLKHIEAPGLEIRQVLTRVRNDVITATREKQVPWDASSLRGDFYFSAAPAPAQPEARPAAPGGAATDEVSFWQGIRDSRSTGDFKAYLERWPNGLFAALARARIAEIERAAAEEAKRGEEQRKKAAEDQRTDAERKARDEARQDADRKRGQADALARIAAQRLEQAKGALRQNRYFDAKRLAEESAALVKEAGDLSAGSNSVQGAGRDLAAFQGELDMRIAARAAVLVREARGFIAQKKFAEAEKRLVEAEGIAPASTVAVRRELETAQGRAEADAEARKRAEDEAKKKAEEAKSGTPDPKKQAQTANSWYAPERNRGLVAFAHKKATLEPGAVAALEKLVAGLRGQKDYKITLIAVADRSEGTAAELQALSRARLATIQQWFGGKSVSALDVRVGVGGTRDEGPDHRVVLITVNAGVSEKRDDKTASPSPLDGAAEITRRLSGAEWRGTVTTSELNFQIRSASAYAVIARFQANGTIRVIGTPAGGAVAQPETAEYVGTWAVSEGRICTVLAIAAGGQKQCYAAAIGDDGAVALSGAGFFNGKRFAK